MTCTTITQKQTTWQGFEAGTVGHVLKTMHMSNSTIIAPKKPQWGGAIKDVCVYVSMLF